MLSTSPEEDHDEADSPDAGDLDKEGKEDEVREHVVDILFNKDKISSIQKQVRSMIKIFYFPLCVEPGIRNKN